MSGARRRFSRLDVRWLGDGNFSARRPSGVAGHDANHGGNEAGSVCRVVDELHHGAFSVGGCVGRTEFRLDWGPTRARARDDAKHIDLLGVYRLVLFRAGAMAPGGTEICGSIR